MALCSEREIGFQIGYELGLGLGLETAARIPREMLVALLSIGFIRASMHFVFP